MSVKLLTEHHLELLSLKGGCKGSSESTHVKMPHCWKSHAMAHIICLIVWEFSLIWSYNVCLQHTFLQVISDESLECLKLELFPPLSADNP